MTFTMQTPRVRIKSVCTFPEAGAMLPAYIVEQLDDAQAETIELHLNECLRCKEHYLTMLEARSGAPERPVISVKNDQDETPVAPSPVEPVENPTSPVQRKGKASGT